MHAGSIPRRARWALLLAALLQVLGAVAEPILHASGPATLGAKVGVELGVEVETESGERPAAAAEPGCGCFLCRAPGASCLPHASATRPAGAPAAAPLVSTVQHPPVVALTGYLSRGPPLT